MGNLAIPNRYVGLVYAHVKKDSPKGKPFERANCCVLESVDGSPIKKSKELSWRVDNPTDHVAHLRKLQQSVLDVAELQTEAQKHLPPEMRFPVDVIASTHATPREVVEAELDRLPITPREPAVPENPTVEDLGVAMLKRSTRNAILRGNIENLAFRVVQGSIDVDVYAFDERKEAQYKKWHDEALAGDKDSLNELRKVLLSNVIDSIVDTGGQRQTLGFLAFKDSYTEYMNIPEVTEYVQEALEESGHGRIDLRFPSDEANDFYYNVMRPKMQTMIDQHRRYLLDLEQGGDGISVVGQSQDSLEETVRRLADKLQAL